MSAQPFRRAAAIALIALSLAHSSVRSAEPAPIVHIVYMGGNDCPPCVNWRRFELPKLEKSEEFKAIRFSYVRKTVESYVPPTLFLPEEVKPLKAKLDSACSSGGSPQTAIFVNGEVYDYFWGTRSAEEIVAMLAAIRSGTTYPFQRCLKLERRECAVKG